MLKITTHKENKVIRFVVEGKLTSASISVLENCWRDAKNSTVSEIHFQFNDITFIDDSAKRLLKRMSQHGIKLFAKDIQMKAILENICSKNQEETMLSKKFSLGLLCIFALMLFSASTAQSQETEKWNYTAAFYMWMSGVDGTVGALGRTVDAEASFSDLISNTKFGVMTGLLARKGRLSISGDFIYVRLGTEEQIPPFKVDIEIIPTMLEGTGGYQIGKNVDAYAGIRFYSVENNITFNGPVNVEVDATKRWVDPIVGLRFTPDFSKRFSLLAKADVGGFGAGSDLSWQLQAYGLLHLNDKSSIAFGYRVLDIDYKEES
ncbi:MAG TPA: hypothetical protein VH815_06685, partial [Acidobacteriota bacterium]